MQHTLIPRSKLLLGFSYGLASDGSPGSYNQALAESIKNILDDGIKDVWVAMQWEIYDALEELYAERDEAVPADVVPLSLVATPPPFNPDDLRDKDEFIASINRQATASIAVLREKFLNVLGHTDAQAFGAPNNEISNEMLAVYLNALLDDPFFYQDFTEVVPLKALVRKAKNRAWHEERVMPEKNEYPQGLRHFQRRRVNRLIIEEVIPEAVLKRGGYLSTRGVFDQIIPAIGRAGRDIKIVQIYGHPVHRSRCQSQFLDYLWDKDWPLAADLVTFGKMDEFWDPTTAQDWCRSRVAWDQYEIDPGKIK